MNLNVSYNGTCGGGNHFFFTVSMPTTIEKIVVEPGDLIDGARREVSLDEIKRRLHSFLREDSGLTDPLLATKLSSRTLQI